MLTANTSKWVAAGVAAGLIVFDIFFATDRVRGNTWSEVIHHLVMRVPVIPWAWGVLMGHFFGRGLAPTPFASDREAGIAVLLWFSVAIQVVGVGLGVHPLICGFLGVIAGAICWSV